MSAKLFETDSLSLRFNVHRDNKGPLTVEEFETETIDHLAMAQSEDNFGYTLSAIEENMQVLDEICFELESLRADDIA